MEGYLKKRVKTLFSNIEDKKVSHILINNYIEQNIDSTFFYLTGLKSGIFEDSIAIASRDGNVSVITNPLEAETAKSAGIDVIIPEHGQDGLKKALAKILSGHGNLGINYAGTVMKNYIRIENALYGSQFVDISKSIETTRLIKDSEEIKLLKKSAKIASCVFPRIKEAIKDGIKETELAALINYNLMKIGAEAPSFDTICGTGKNSSQPHHVPESNVAIKKGDFVVCDFGARVARYCSDLTRTFIFGKDNKEKRDIYNSVYNAQASALSLIKDGINGFDIYHIANNTIDQAGYKGRFTHGIGHSLGLDVHDSSVVFPFGEAPLKEGMVLTIEPGIYIPELGGVRIEDDILVTKKGYELLTDAPKEWEDVFIKS